MRLLVCGGRDFSDKDLAYDTLDKVLKKYGDSLEIIQGDAAGADRIALGWAQDRQVNYRGFPAKWRKLGIKAGPIRNKYMRDNSLPDACIAFKGGDGTMGMVNLMKEVGINPWMVGWG